MKSPQTAINFILGLAVGFLIYKVIFGQDFGGNKDKPTADTAASAGDSLMVDISGIDIPQSDSLLPIAYVNTDSLLENYNYYKTQKKLLDDKAMKLDADLGKRMQTLQGEMEIAQKKAQAGAMTPAQMSEAEEDLMRKQQELGMFRDTRSKSLLDQEGKLTEELNRRIKEVVKRMAVKGKYRFVLGYSSKGGILYADPRHDITSEVLDGLNQSTK